VSHTTSVRPALRTTLLFLLASVLFLGASTAQGGRLSADDQPTLSDDHSVFQIAPQFVDEGGGLRNRL